MPHRAININKYFPKDALLCAKFIIKVVVEDVPLILYSGLFGHGSV
jgi:hypothetical protein